MFHLTEVSGVKSSPISKSILENSLGKNLLKDSRAFANYEFLLDSIAKGTANAPSVILASGNGSFYPKTASYQNNFYSANILGRDDYLNSWQQSYCTDEGYELTYYDGSTLFKEFKIDPGTGRAKLKSLELRNGNLPGQAGFIQLLLGYNATSAINDIGYYRHNIRSRHSEENNSENAIDVFLWDKDSDTKTENGSKRVLSLYGTGSVELVNGTYIFGSLNIDVSDQTARDIETATLSIPGKGVIYYNENSNKYRYSENGGPFKNFGGSSVSTGSSGIESISLRQCSTFRNLFDATNPNSAIGVYLYAEEEITINKISTVIPALESGAAGNIQFAIYAPPYIENSGNVLMFGNSGSLSMSLVAKGEIPIISATNTVSNGTLTTPVTLKGWYCVVLSNAPSASWPSIYAGVNYSEQASVLNNSELQYQIPLQFIRRDIVIPGEPIADMWPSTINALYATNVNILNKNIVPYIKVGVA